MKSASSASTSLKEYLKKYTSTDDEELKKNKKKKKAKPEYAGVLVVDEDPVWLKPTKLEEEEEDLADEEKPQVDEDIEVKRIKRLEQLRSKRPYGAISEDGSGWVSVSDMPSTLKPENRNSDISPPRVRRRRNDTPSPKPEDGNFDISPPCARRRRNDTPSAKHEDQNSDISPPRVRRRRNDTPSPRREEQPYISVDSDLSPPRQRRKCYQSPSQSEMTLSPPRRPRGEKHALPPEAERKSSYSRFTTSDISPPRRARRDSKYQDDHTASSPSDLSPPRKVKNNRSASMLSANSDLSPPRRRKGSPILVHQSKTGLVSHEDIKEEIFKKKKEDLLRFKDMDSSYSGRDADAIYRDKITGKRMSKEEFLKSQKKEEKPKEIKIEWGKGLAQKREAEARLQEIEEEKDKPFARSRDDADLDKVLKERLRWGDPMAHLVKKKQLDSVLPDLGDSEKMKESGFIIPQEIPSYSWIKRGLEAAPNRYGIRPGRHWDGVDRSTGYEKQLFKRTNEKKATEREAYLWSVSDM